MSYLKAVHLRNWQPFRGEHHLTLQPKAYAVTAHQDGDRGRSNWAGKSSLLEAIRFAFYGVHRHRTEDEWISHGEKLGEVSIEFDDGFTVTRSRHLGKATRLYTSEGGVQAYKDEATSRLLERIGLSLEDFDASCYFEQKAMNRIVTMDAGERMRIISSWFGLGPLQHAAKLVSEQLGRMVKMEETIRNKIALQKSLFESALNSVTAKTVAEMQKDLKESEADLEVALGELATAQENIAKNEQLLAGQANIARYDAIMLQGKHLAELVKAANPSELETKYAAAEVGVREAQGKVALARKAYEQKKALSRGQFDGTCPVAGIACPVKKEINSANEQNTKLFELAKKDLETAQEEQQQAEKRMADVATYRRNHERNVAELRLMREQERSMRASVELAKKTEPADREELAAIASRAQAKVIELKTEQKTIQAAITQADASLEELTRLEAEMQTITSQILTHREAVAIFGPGGAQRKVAESALSEIEDGTNALLRDCDIPLSVEVQWSREGSGIASACYACGAPFPTSAKVKACERCGEARGKNIVNKLDVVLSNRSGAAEDLAGGALQLAASAWLRNARSSGWGTALLDEPFSALDKTLRRSFAARLVTMLGRSAFEQSLIISHTADTVEMLPGRIEIVSDGKWAKFGTVS